jgi:uncharacterized membrane protein YjgN (DUF898 family)
MKCVQHSDRDVVGTCLVCGGGLCPACFGRYASPLCASHGVAQRAAGQRSIRRGLLIVGILAAFGFLLGIARGIGTALLDAYILGATYYGCVIVRRGLSRFDFILIMPITGWIIYFGFMLLAGVLVGVFVAPFGFRRQLRQLAALRADAELGFQ